MKIISLNVRGLGDGWKRMQIKSFLKEFQADLVIQQESKLKLIDNKLVCSLWGKQFVDWLHLDDVGASGEILLMWDKRVLTKIEEVVRRYAVSCKFQNVKDNFTLAFSGVYGPNRDESRCRLWEELAGFGSL